MSEPYCSHCGYCLTGVTDSPHCPECGRPLVEVLVRDRAMVRLGRRYRSKIRLFGLPLVDVAIGPSGGQLKGFARGIIAIGDVAVGVFAFGGVSLGVFSAGGVSAGLASFGGVAIGLLVGMGGLATGGLASGGLGVGVVAHGGLAVGVIAEGGLAYASYLGRGGVAYGRHVVSQTGSTPGADQVAARWAWLIGSRPGTYWVALWAVIAALAWAAVLGGLIMFCRITGLGITGQEDDDGW